MAGSSHPFIRDSLKTMKLRTISSKCSRARNALPIWFKAQRDEFLYSTFLQKMKMARLVALRLQSADGCSV